MNYELAKKLKEAGFPPRDRRCMACVETHLGCDMTVMPPLSELIEACGEKFGSLTRSYGDTVFKWKAIDSEHQIGRLANTPEEAVAELWLALNKKA